MGRAKETFGKKEVRNKQLKKRKDKEKRRTERKEQGKTSFDDMIAWVDENGQICSEQPDLSKKEKIDVNSIEISVPKGGIKGKDKVLTGKVRNYDDTKGFGFISVIQLNDSVFFHVNDCTEEIKVGDKVEFETEKGLKGLKAINIRKAV
ncbi:MAG: cold shock domain-containing protein [Bacteroidales bacterium]|nr:cold shock domain-containing protein [Bacteroidales bacterium]MBN2820240.1 cold shock domain-containing protein [Bacteroidales bacterium]